MAQLHVPKNPTQPSSSVSHSLHSQKPKKQALTTAMVSQYGIKYAVHIITNHFGPLVAKVCDCLLKKGPLPLREIVRYTELSETLVRNCLLVLIQHNCLQPFLLEEEGGFGEVNKVSSLYMVLFDNVLHRVRFSKFMAIVSQEFNKLCVDLIETLLQHGRLSSEQIFDGFRDSTEGSSSGGMEALQENIHKLVMARYVERCPISEPFLALPSEEEAAPARRRGAKSAKVFLEPETLEQRVLAAAVPPEGMRFSFELNPEIGADREKAENSSTGDKRKLDALESGTDGGFVDKQVVLWRVNCEEFTRRLRHKICIEIVRTRLDDEAATVFTAMLNASRSEEKKIKTASSVPLSENSIYAEVIKSEKGRNMTLDYVISVLVGLSSSPPFVRVVDNSYSIDYKHIIEVAQTDEVESIVYKKYGKDAYRMFRLLSKTGRFLETDKISDSIFVEKKETANILSKMWQGDYLQMEKLVAGPTQFLLWKVNMINLRERVLDDMFHASLNLSLRVAYELEQQKEILHLGVDGPMKEKYEKLKKVRFLLESSRMKLDDAIMIFHDF
ncbi:RNA polymerase III DNA DIRECTED -RELATED [Salix purpurea]|uniref:DNA-directed RNA polymerase III subunit RPC3 n=1 Tax=Salix purpurea TaxID=77065 RepID=A0A9Q0W628_SALPP|nr:RNA polymerase III DNA DIRECTED -RELATED [Salix purpurea]